MATPFVGVVKQYLPQIIEAVNTLPDDFLMDLRYLNDVLSDSEVPFLEGMAAFAFYTGWTWRYLIQIESIAFLLNDLGPLAPYAVAEMDTEGFDPKDTEWIEATWLEYAGTPLNREELDRV